MSGGYARQPLMTVTMLVMMMMMMITRGWALWALECITHANHSMPSIFLLHFVTL